MSPASHSPEPTPAIIIGPLVGGVFADKASWRWIFFINLPFGGIAMAVLLASLHLRPHAARPLAAHVREFDFGGLALVVGGAVCVLIGFNHSEVAWNSAATIALLAVGGVLLVAFGANELLTTRSPIVAPRLFKAGVPAAMIFTNFLHALAFFSTSYYLPVYFQVIGNSATGAGARMLPFSLVAALVALASGQLLSRALVGARPIVWFAWGVITLGYGLMIQLSDRSTRAEKELYPLVAAVGVGCLFTVPLIVLQAAMPVADIATSTGAFGFTRQLGGTIGISVGQAILSSSLQKRVRAIPGLAFDTSPAALAQGVRELQGIADPGQRAAVVHAYSSAISQIWLVLTPMLGAGLVAVLALRNFSSERRAGAVEGTGGDAAAPLPAPGVVPEEKYD